MMEQPVTFGPITAEVFDAIAEQYPQGGQTFHGDVKGISYDPLLDTLLEPVTEMIVNSPEVGLASEPYLIRYLVKTAEVPPQRTLLSPGWHIDGFSLAMVATKEDWATEFIIRDKQAETGLNPAERFGLWQDRRDFMKQFVMGKNLKSRFDEVDMEHLKLKLWSAKAGEFAIFYSNNPHRSPFNTTSEAKARTCLQASVITRKPLLQTALEKLASAANR